MSDAGSAATLLTMTGIGKSFAGQKVLDDVRFEIRAGEVHILAGENGAGKSTLIKIMAGVHTEYEGEIHLGGGRVRFRSPQDAARRGISVIHQELSLIPSLSVSDNIYLGREIHRDGWINKKRQRTECRKLLAQLGIDADPDRLAGDYSLSCQQLIEIAKALSIDARVIIMDEPTSALTEPEVRKLFNIIADLKARGCGIIYISHKMEEIYQIADRITVLRDGKYIGTSPAGELPRAELIKWMVGRDVQERFPRHESTSGAVRLKAENIVLRDRAGLPRNVVDGVSFEVRAGEILGIGGLQGSGASELLNALFGTYGRPSSGNVLVDGKPYAMRSPGSAMKAGVALLTNDRKETGLVLGMSIARNVTLPSLRRYSRGGWMRHRMERQAAENCRTRFRVRCAGVTQEVGFLSGGNQQKVALAKWLETNPKVLLLDEPTRGVDIGAKEEIYQMMNEWKSQGIAIVLITSEMPELLALSDRIIVMHRGKVTAEFSGAEATGEKILNAAMGHE